MTWTALNAKSRVFGSPTLQEGPRDSQDRPKTGHEASKTAPRRPKRKSPLPAPCSCSFLLRLVVILFLLRIVLVCPTSSLSSSSSLLLPSSTSMSSTLSEQTPWAKTALPVIVRSGSSKPQRPRGHGGGFRFKDVSKMDQEDANRPPRRPRTAYDAPR